MIILQSLRNVLAVETWSLPGGPGASRSSKTEAISDEPIMAYSGHFCPLNFFTNPKQQQLVFLIHLKFSSQAWSRLVKPS
jgi:hypothetical protein